ncbi:hypothetical protein H5410_045620 [Solanum commersonii]|uniref:Uncharacterized protein n=1 Tax=Solanum commersonii TaxID=4109 RepID=A0A9J5XBN9_SOLCO|nr:hypothetical protein H5410_045620 [Solanum commersonii]
MEWTLSDDMTKHTMDIVGRHFNGVDYKTSDRDPLLDEQYRLGPFGKNVPLGLRRVSQENNGYARIFPGQHYSGHYYLWYGIITKNGTFVCRVVYVPIGESIESEIPAVINFSTETGYLSSRYRIGVVKLGDEPTCSWWHRQTLLGSGISLPPEFYLPRYVDAHEITSSQVSQPSSFLTNDLITSLSNFQPQSRVVGTAGASYSKPAWDVIVAPQSRRYVDR